MSRLMYGIGEIRHSDTYGKYKIIDFVSKKGYTIKFLGTGYIATGIKSGNITKDYLKDYLFPSVHGVGCLGKPNNKKNNPIAYNIWTNMLARCYNEDSDKYEYYGRKGIAVCSRWHNFNNFIQDIKNLNGYDKSEFINNKIFLDKDFNGGSIYSPSNCIWLSVEENGSYQPSCQNLFKALSPSGDLYYHYSIRSFSKIFKELNHNGVNAVLSGKQNYHKDWKFEYIDKLPDGLTPFNINSQFDNIK